MMSFCSSLFINKMMIGFVYYVVISTFELFDIFVYENFECKVCYKMNLKKICE